MGTKSHIHLSMEGNTVAARISDASETFYRFASANLLNCDKLHQLRDIPFKGMLYSSHAWILYSCIQVSQVKPWLQHVWQVQWIQQGRGSKFIETAQKDSKIKMKKYKLSSWIKLYAGEPQAEHSACHKKWHSKPANAVPASPNILPFASVLPSPFPSISFWPTSFIPSFLALGTFCFRS